MANYTIRALRSWYNNRIAVIIHEMARAIRSHMLAPALMANYTIRALRSWYNNRIAVSGLFSFVHFRFHGQFCVKSAAMAQDRYSDYVTLKVD